MPKRKVNEGWPTTPRKKNGEIISNRCVKLRSLKVVPGPPPPLTRGKAVNWVLLPHLDEKGYVVDYRPRKQHRDTCFGTMVLWRSRQPHCGAYPQRKGGFGLVSTVDHYQLDKLEEALDFAREFGYVVLEVPEIELSKEQRDAYLKLLVEDVASIQETGGNAIKRLSDIKSKHLPSYDGNGIRSYGGLCHAKFAGAMREHPSVKKVFKTIFGTSELSTSLDAPAISLKVGKKEGFTHQDQDIDHDYESWQCCFVLAAGIPRVGQMISMKPWLSEESRKLCEEAIEIGSSMTHDNARVNKPPVPVGAYPLPKKGLLVYNAEHAVKIGDTTYKERNYRNIPTGLPVAPPEEVTCTHTVSEAEQVNAAVQHAKENGEEIDLTDSPIDLTESV